MEHAPRVTAPRIAHSLWEHHRSTIERLFVVEERTLVGKGGVIDIMTRDHDFCASKSQYEARLKQWGIRKKITEQEWRVILLRVQRRANQGRQTEIVFKGMALSEQRIARELARRSSSDLNKNDREFEFSDPRTPEGFAIHSPPNTAAMSEDSYPTQLTPTPFQSVRVNYGLQNEKSVPSSPNTAATSDNNHVTQPISTSPMLIDQGSGRGNLMSSSSSATATRGDGQATQSTPIFPGHMVIDQGIKHKEYMPSPLIRVDISEDGFSSPLTSTSSQSTAVERKDQRGGSRLDTDFRTYSRMPLMNWTDMIMNGIIRGCKDGCNCHIPYDVWICENCHCGNLIALAAYKCPICGHENNGAGSSY